MTGAVPPRLFRSAGHPGARAAPRPARHADALHPELLLGDGHAAAAAIAGNPPGEHRAQRVEAPADLGRLVHVARQRGTRVIVDRRVAGNLIEMGAVVQQPAIAAYADVVE